VFATPTQTVLAMLDRRSAALQFDNPSPDPLDEGRFWDRPPTRAAGPLGPHEPMPGCVDLWDPQNAALFVERLGGDGDR